MKPLSSWIDRLADRLAPLASPVMNQINLIVAGLFLILSVIDLVRPRQSRWVLWIWGLLIGENFGLWFHERFGRKSRPDRFAPVLVRTRLWRNQIVVAEDSKYLFPPSAEIDTENAYCSKVAGLASLKV